MEYRFAVTYGALSMRHAPFCIYADVFKSEKGVGFGQIGIKSGKFAILASKKRARVGIRNLFS